VCGAEAAGTATGELLRSAGVADVVVCDADGPICATDPAAHPRTRRLAELTNPRGVVGSVDGAVQGADVLIGLSAPGAVTERGLAGMAPGAVVFALGAPEPEIDPDLAARHAAIVATGRPDIPNQISDVLAFGGLLRGVLDARLCDVGDAVLLAAARAIADAQPTPTASRLLPDALDPTVPRAVAAAVRTTADRQGRRGVRASPEAERS
jgi:malate dehydrogenase (oxaloacetate-decarboxylating)